MRNKTKAYVARDFLERQLQHLERDEHDAKVADNQNKEFWEQLEIKRRVTRALLVKAGAVFLGDKEW